MSHGLATRKGGGSVAGYNESRGVQCTVWDFALPSGALMQHNLATARRPDRRVVCMQEVHRYFRCMAYDEAELRLIIVGDNGQAGKASSSQQLASALSVSIWDVSSMLRPVMSSLCGKRQVRLQSIGHSNHCSSQTAPHLVADPVCPGLGCTCLCVMSTIASLSCIVPIDTQICSAFLDMPETGNLYTSLILVDHLMTEFAVHIAFSSGGPKDWGCV